MEYTITITKACIKGVEVYFSRCSKYPGLIDCASTKEEAERLMRESIEMAEAIIKENEE